MEESYSDSDVTLSPTQIFDRLQVLRQLQLLQRGKLQKQCLEYKNTPDQSTSHAEIISHFSSSTSYNTFKSLLQFSQDTSDKPRPDIQDNVISPKVNENDLLEGISILNLSQESQFIIQSPVSSNRSKSSFQSQNRSSQSIQTNSRNKIALDEMPILTPKTDFESLLLEKIHKENIKSKTNNTVDRCEIKMPVKKKPFLKRGEGMNRIGLKKNDLVIQNTKSLPWKKRDNKNGVVAKKNIPTAPIKTQTDTRPDDKIDIQFPVPELKTIKKAEPMNEITNDILHTNKNNVNNNKNTCSAFALSFDCLNDKSIHKNDVSPNKSLSAPSNKHPLHASKGKTWAAILTKEQDDFLRQLKQSDYYKNFVSPAKSTASNISYDDYMDNTRLNRESAEQNMFDLLENKVNQENFNLENSFFAKFLRKSHLESSGESTPLVLQKCISNNPNLLHIFPTLKGVKNKPRIALSAADDDSEYTDCDHETCSSVSTCCSCKTVEETNHTLETPINQAKKTGKRSAQNPNRTPTKTTDTIKEAKVNKVNDNVRETDELKANMAEMNTNLVATSELLKDRLRELEDEIETFRKENMNLTKMREEIDLERQKFYEEKSNFEQKYNEEKILNEYYLAEEKEKLIKQKQMYDRYLREIRGRLNKKDKDEVAKLKQEINELKEEIRIKDAKSTTSIARLRNQLKTLEKDKKDLDIECEKLRKENRILQHAHDTTRRLTNTRYLEEINRKLSSLSTKDSKSDVFLNKSKVYDSGRQSRISKVNYTGNNPVRKRAKSVPNLNVTSRYAKYFSQRDVVSQMEQSNMLNVEKIDVESNISDDDRIDIECYDKNDNVRHKLINSNDSVKDFESEDENNLEKIYSERFKTISPANTSQTSWRDTETDRQIQNPTKFAANATSDPFFLSKSSYKSSNISSKSTSPINDKLSNESNTSKSPISILSSKSSISYKSPLVVEADVHREESQNFSSEPISKTSLTKTSLNPTEIKRTDGSRELRFPNGNIKYLSADGKYSKFSYYNGDIKETFYNEGRIKYFYADTKTYHTTHADGMEVLEFSDGQVEKRYKDGSSEIRLPNGSVRYSDPKNHHVREEWRFPDGTVLTVSPSGEQLIRFTNGQIEVHNKDHKRREFPDGTVKMVYPDGTSETRYASGRIRIKDKHGNLLLDSGSR